MNQRDPLTLAERDALRRRTVRALRNRWHFQHLPVQVGSPCLVCGGLFWLITGKEPIAPRGYCLNCNPGILEKRPDLLRLVAESMLDLDEEEEQGIPAPDINFR